MFKEIRDNPRALFFAILVHAALAVLLVASLNWTARPKPAGPKVDVVQAVVVDEAKVQAELDKLKEADKRKEKEQENKKRAEQARVETLRKKREAEEKRLADLKAKRAAEERKRKEQERERKREEERLAKVKQEQAVLEEKRAAEQKRLAELAAKRKIEEEQRRQAEEEAKRQAEEEAKRQAEEARQRREAELRAQIEAEEQVAREAAARREIDKYILLIQQKVQRNWLRPGGAAKVLSCTVTVGLIPGGEVVSVNVTKSSGNAVFDRSVENAVRKASPLPLPTEPGLVDRMREINFVFEPKD